MGRAAASQFIFPPREICCIIESDSAVLLTTKPFSCLSCCPSHRVANLCLSFCAITTSSIIESVFRFILSEDAITIELSLYGFAASNFLLLLANPSAHLVFFCSLVTDPIDPTPKTCCFSKSPTSLAVLPRQRCSLLRCTLLSNENDSSNQTEVFMTA